MTANKAKKLGFGFDLPEGWDLNRIGDLFHLKNGINAGKESYGVGVKFINVLEVINNESLDETLIPGSIKIDDFQKASYLVKFGDVLFNRTSEITNEVGLSSVYLGKEPVVFGGFVIRATEKNKRLDNFFKKYCFRSNLVRNQVIKVGQGAVRSNIGQGDLEKVLIPLPPLPEQQAIAQVLGKMDEVIQTNERMIAQKELRKKWLMQQLLTGRLRLRSASGKKFEGEWKDYIFDKLLKVVKRPVNWDDSELYKLISVRRRSGGIFFREALYGNQIKVKDLREAEVGDFLFSKMQIVHGASALVTKEFEGAKISGSYIAAVAKNEKLLNMEYFNWYSKFPYFYHQSLISSYGVHIEKMTFDFRSFLKLEMKVPSIEEQTAIAQVLQTADHEINLLKTKAEMLREQKKGLMQQLLTGKKRLV